MRFFQSTRARRIVALFAGGALAAGVLTAAPAVIPEAPVASASAVGTPFYYDVDCPGNARWHQLTIRNGSQAFIAVAKAEFRTGRWTGHGTAVPKTINYMPVWNGDRQSYRMEPDLYDVNHLWQYHAYCGY